MKSLVLMLSILFSFASFADVDFVNHKGKIVRMDQKTVTVEIAGTNYKLYRDKLGKEFAMLKKGDVIDIQVTKDSF